MRVFVKFMDQRLELENADIDTLSRIVIINDSMFTVLRRNSSCDEQFRVNVLLSDSGGKLAINNDTDLMEAWEDHIIKGCEHILFEVEKIYRESEFEVEAANEIVPEAFNCEVEVEDEIVGEAFDSEAEDEAENEIDVEEVDSDGDENPMQLEDEDDTLLNGYQSDNGDFGEITDSEDEHPFSLMSRMYAGDQYREGNERITLRVGMVFRNLKILRETLIDYCIQEGFRLKRSKFEKRRVICRCHSEDCAFKIYAVLQPFGECLQIRAFNDNHICARLIHNPEATSTWVARRCHDIIVSAASAPLEDLQESITNEYGVVVSKNRIYRARKMVLNEGSSEHAASFSMLWDYANVINEKMPGALVRLKYLKTNPDVRNCQFLRFMLSFPALREGFKQGCRPFIGLDGCHLKGPFKGILLSAVSLDGNHSIFPIAVAWVESENTSSWTWFLSLLRDYLGDERLVTFITDRQKGIMSSLASEWPNSPVRYCCRHIFANLKIKFPHLELRDLFWGAARAASKETFIFHMNKIKALKKDAYDWLMEIDPNCWSLHCFEKHVKCDHVTNNMTESWNAWLGGARKKPIIDLMEHIRKRMMKTIVERRSKCGEWKTDISPYIYSKLVSTLKMGRHCRVTPSSETLFEVDDYGVSFVVDIEKHECGCCVWQVSGIPCRHAMPCLEYLRLDYPSYVWSYFKKDSYLRCYAGMIHPLPDRTVWPHQELDEIQPPFIRRAPGRPKTCRRREVDEMPAHRRKFMIKCSVCKGLGHNKRACPLYPLNFNKQTRSVKRNRTDMEASSSGASNLAAQPPPEAPPEAPPPAQIPTPSLDDHALFH